MPADLWALYADMLRSRRFEEALSVLWAQDLISGEMHLGMGEEALVAGIVAHLEEGDALALDHRGTPPLVMRGVDLVQLMREMLGREDGLCHGWGGHMHLFDPGTLSASSGIVGASGPAGVGFALASQALRPGKLAVAFFGEGAMNQGTEARSVTAGNLVTRAGSFDLPAVSLDGGDVEAVWSAAGEAVTRARGGDGPSFLHARLPHLEGHFLGDPFRRFSQHPWQEFKHTLLPMVRALFGPSGLPWRARLGNLAGLQRQILAAWQVQRQQRAADPLLRLRARLASNQPDLEQLEDAIRDEIQQVVKLARL
jgi:TPP-dependent pyruvate/acetoin dehydrogenase alpha subunit